jgi:hypothetical protein
MEQLDRILGGIALVAGLLVLAGILSTDAYSRGALVQASGDEALTHLIAPSTDTLSLNDAAPATPDAGIRHLAAK